MPESSAHMDFVQKCGDYICDHIVPSAYSSFVLYDTPDSIQKPPAVEGGVHPDIYYNHAGLLVIGEAKTINDIDNLHSRKQYEYYFKECEQHIGNCFIVICSTWSVAPQLWKIVMHIKKNNNYKAQIIVIYELGVYKAL